MQLYLPALLPLYTMYHVWSWTLRLSLSSVYNTSNKQPVDIKLACYRLDYRSSYDEELVWALVQRHGGHISIGPDYIHFWIAPEWEIVLNMAFPDLIRRSDLDYV